MKASDWYKDAIIYELHIKAFRDSNADGVGDFKGLLQKLDYLQELGVTAIWLLPFYPSPQKDDGYDISDYYSINPAYGTVEEFKHLLAEAHQRKINVIIELVINHTSWDHPWFQRARNAPVGSVERNYYVWSEDPNKYPDVRIIFQDFEPSNWTFDPIAQQYYWHRFYQHQPDLNYSNPVVQDEVFKILDYWCAMGVDGFRLDAVPYLFEKEGTNSENLPETHGFLKKLRARIDDRFPGTLLLAEANMWPEDSASYFGNGDECHMNFHFPLMPRLFMSLQMEDRYPITDIFDQTPAIPPNCQWALFLRNHDELTLEMVTDEERDYMYNVYVQDPKARINLGIRHRLAPLLKNNRKKIELLNALLFSLPGTPVLYYGDEIGMGDNFYLGDRNGVRTPMQWSADRNAGFSEANPQKLFLPIILDPEYHYEAINVDIQQQNTSSLLWWTRRMIAKRKQYKVFGRGDLTFVACSNSKILAFTRCYKDESMLVVVNLSRHTQPAELTLKNFAGFQPVELFSHNKFPTVQEAPYFLTMASYACEWFLLEKTAPLRHEGRAIPVVSSEWTSHDGFAELEAAILPAYLNSARWFGGKGGVVEYMRITDSSTFHVESRPEVLIIMLEIKYENGRLERYQLALTTIEASDETFQNKFPNAILAQFKKDDLGFLLIDAFYSHDFQQALLKNPSPSIRFFPASRMKEQIDPSSTTPSRVLSADTSNTCILYGDKLFLKLFRKLDFTINPDVELSSFLSHAEFKNIPCLLGDIEWQTSSGKVVLGVLQEQITHGNDGWNYMLDRIKLYYERILARKETIDVDSLPGTSLMEPISFENIPSEMKTLIGPEVLQNIQILGLRTAEMHLALSNVKNQDPAFQPENYSLHYQRSLFSGMQSLVRQAFQNLEINHNALEDRIAKQAADVLKSKELVLGELRKIYANPITAQKIRIHGDYHLGQVLFTGKDFIITDFEGEPARAFSERKLKRSPLRDVAGMIRSFHYVAHGALILGDKVNKRDVEKLTICAELWYRYARGMFLKAYFDKVNGALFIPRNTEHLATLLRTFLLEKAVYELNYEINNRPKWVGIPLLGIQAILTDSNPSARSPVTPHPEAVPVSNS